MDMLDDLEYSIEYKKPCTITKNGAETADRHHGRDQKTFWALPPTAAQLIVCIILNKKFITLNSYFAKKQNGWIFAEEKAIWTVRPLRTPKTAP